MSLTDLIGKTLYPRQQRWERRRNVKTLLAVVIITLVIIAIFALVMVLNGSGPARPGGPLQSASS
jgi:predicted PurR-regulated permease PerM